MKKWRVTMVSLWQSEVNMAKYLLEEVCPGLLAGSGAKATSVRIWETDESYAEASL